MKRGETAEIKCSEAYAYGDEHPAGATVTLSLHEIYEVRDVSFATDGSVLKKQVKEGEGDNTPKDGSRVKLRVETAMHGASVINGFRASTLEFVAGDGEVCDALECAVAEMKRGERAVLIVSKPELLSDEKLGLKGVVASPIELSVELKDFAKTGETWSMSEDEKLEWGLARKERGSELLKVGRLAMALQRYKNVIDTFRYLDGMQEENKSRAKALKFASELNSAVVHLRLKDFVEARSACNSVLREDTQNVKALYRRAQAEFGLKNFLECIGDCRKVVELDAQNKDARALLRQAQAAQREEDKKAKGVFANMCKAFGGARPSSDKRPRLEGAEGDVVAPLEGVAPAKPIEPGAAQVLAEDVPMGE